MIKESKQHWGDYNRIAFLSITCCAQQANMIGLQGDLDTVWLCHPASTAFFQLRGSLDTGF